MAQTVDLQPIKTDITVTGSIIRDIYLEDGKLPVEFVGSTNGIKKVSLQNLSSDEVEVENGSLQVNIKKVNNLNSGSGSINISSSLHIPSISGSKMGYNNVSVQILSSNISTPTIFYVEFSLDQVNWNTETQDLLVQSETKLFVFQYPAGAFWRIRFDSGNSGIVNYIILN